MPWILASRTQYNRCNHLPVPLPKTTCDNNFKRLLMTYMVASRGVLTVLNRCMMTWREQYSVNIRTKPPIRYTQNAARASGLNSDQVLKIYKKKTSLSDDKYTCHARAWKRKPWQVIIPSKYQITMIYRECWVLLYHWDESIFVIISYLYPNNELYNIKGT